MTGREAFAVGYRNEVALEHAKSVERKLLIASFTQIGLLLVVVIIGGAIAILGASHGSVSVGALLPFIVLGVFNAAMAIWYALRRDAKRRERPFMAASPSSPLLVMEPEGFRIAHSRGVLTPYRWDEVVLHARPADLGLPELLDLWIGPMRLELVGPALSEPSDRVLGAAAHFREQALRSR